MSKPNQASSCAIPGSARMYVPPLAAAGITFVLVVVEEDLEVHERGGRVPDDVAQREELGLPVGRHLPRDDRVAREGDRHVPAGILEGLGLERRRRGEAEAHGEGEPGEREAGRAEVRRRRGARAEDDTGA